MKDVTPCQAHRMRSACALHADVLSVCWGVFVSDSQRPALVTRQGYSGGHSRLTPSLSTELRIS